LTVPCRFESTNLKDVLKQKVPAEQDNVKNFRKEYGSTVIGEVTVDMVRDSRKANSLIVVIDFVHSIILQSYF